MGSGEETFLVLNVFIGVFYKLSVQLIKFFGCENLTLGVRLCKVFTKLDENGFTMGFLSGTNPRYFFFSYKIDIFQVLRTLLKSSLNSGCKKEKKLSLFCYSVVSQGSRVSPYLSFSVRYFSIIHFSISLDTCSI